MRSREEQELDRAMRFRPCEYCSYDFATHTGTKTCHLYECPYLPAVLDVACPRCAYNFETEDGRSECGDPPTCEFAQHEAPRRVEALHRWIEENGG